MTDFTPTRNFHRLMADALENQDFVKAKAIWNELCAEVGYTNAEGDTAGSEFGKHSAEVLNERDHPGDGILTSKYGKSS